MTNEQRAKVFEVLVGDAANWPATVKAQIEEAVLEDALALEPAIDEMLEQARREALEEAAGCAEFVSQYHKFSEPTPQAIPVAIRSLKEKNQEKETPDEAETIYP